MPPVPALTPVTTPVAVATVATDPVPCTHVPPLTEFDNVVVEPWQSTIVPVIAPGIGLTVIVRVTKQLVPIVYVITAVPTATPLTTPVEVPTSAILALLVLQVPPAVVFANVVVALIHTVDAPVIAAGNGLTVMLVTVKHPVLSL
jgi:hypothetical protein